MKRKLITGLLLLTMTTSLITGCGKSNHSKNSDDGNYKIGFSIDVDDKGNGNSKLNITKNEATSIKLVDYTTSDGYFNLKIPEGWKVREVPNDIIGYALFIYDPKVPSRQVSFYATTASYFSKEAKEINMMYSPDPEATSHAAVNPDLTSSSYFKNSPETLSLFGLSNYSEIAILGDNGFGGQVIQGSATYEDGTEVEGLFTVSSFNVFLSVDYMGINIAPIMDEGLTIITAPADEFPSWQPILTQVYGNINMTDSYMKARAKAWGDVSRSSKAISEMASKTSDIIMSSWESRNNSYDIQSQERSDATLGRERVYDTESGDVYYAENGWYDSYDGSRYKLVESGSDYYNLPVSGTIN